MTYQFGQRRFAAEFGSPLLVIVDPRNTHLSGGLRGTSGGVVARCRRALRHARETGLEIAIARDARIPSEAGADWIAGLEPRASDRMFERHSVDCYESPYFADAANQASEIVLAGFLGRGGCLATAVAAFCAGHKVTFLFDAIDDSLSASVMYNDCAHLIAAFAKFEFRAIPTQSWIKTVRTQLPNAPYTGSSFTPFACG